MRFESLQKVANALSEERSLPALLKRIVSELCQYRGVALARMWVAEPASECEVCSARPEAADPAVGLHLAASLGRPVVGNEVWARIDGEFHRGGPFSTTILKDGRPILIKDFPKEGRVVETHWMRRERIRSFAGYPMIFGGRPVGVLAVLSRIPMKDRDLEWLRIFAVAMAATVINARAVDEIETLRQRLESENAYLRAEVREVAGSSRILGASFGIRCLQEQIDLVAPTDATVLVLGETGVGKELVARAIHERSARRDRPLVKVNCTAIARELFESEFFGHVRGAFSGATGDRMGRFQLADGGTLFLDEIGDLPPEMQPKLLRVLQEGEFERVGDDHTRRSDVRIIAASNRDLARAIEDGRFREDLYYRLSVFPITAPPLREHKEDIPLLAISFVEAACRRFNRAPMRLGAGQLRRLQDYDWPGNVRELQNVIERAVITAQLGDLHFDLGTRPGVPMACDMPALGALSKPKTILTDAEMKQRERDNIAKALQQSGGRIYGRGGAAELLNMRPTTLNARAKKLGLKHLHQ